MAKPDQLKIIKSVCMRFRKIGVGPIQFWILSLVYAQWENLWTRSLSLFRFTFLLLLLLCFLYWLKSRPNWRSKEEKKERKEKNVEKWMRSSKHAMHMLFHWTVKCAKQPTDTAYEFYAEGEIWRCSHTSQLFYKKIIFSFYSMSKWARKQTSNDGHNSQLFSNFTKHCLSASQRLFLLDFFFSL